MSNASSEALLPYFIIGMLLLPVIAAIVAYRDRRRQRQAAMHTKQEELANRIQKRPTGRRARPSRINGTTAVHEKHMRASGPDHRVGNNSTGGPIL